MSTLAAALAVALTAAGAPALPATAPVPEPEPGAMAASPAPAPTPAPLAATPALTLPRSGGPSLGALAAPAVLLAGLGAAALLLARRKARPGRLVQVLETTALGAKRSLVLARLGDEVLLLGASEAGITLLRTQPAEPLAALAPVPDPPPRARRSIADRPEPAALAGLVSRLRGARPASGGPDFDAILTESAEDQELRRKLARGQAGSVR